MRELDELARQHYGCSFNALSAFGQNEIRRKAGEIIPLSSGPTMHDVDLARALVKAQERIAQLELENKDLFNDNEDLQLELMEKEDESSHSRSARSRETRRSARVDQTISDLLIPRPSDFPDE